MLAQMAFFISTPQNLAEQRGGLDETGTEGLILRGPTGSDDNVWALPVNAKMADTAFIGITDHTGGHWPINRYLPYRTSHAAISFRAHPPESRPMPTHQRRTKLSPSPPGAKPAHGH